MPTAPPVTRREILAWAMYDFANSGYTTVVLTAIFNAYFVGVVAGSGPDREDLATSLRRTLVDMHEVMSDMAENTEALKHNWFFRGYFNSRGLYDLDSVSVADYRQGRFAPKLKAVRRWLGAGELFSKGPNTEEVLTDEGKHKLDLAMADFLLEARNTPVMIEGYASAEATHDQFLLSRARAIRVRDYLVRRFSLRSSYIGFIPLGAEGSPEGEFKGADGVAMALFADPKAKQR